MSYHLNVFDSYKNKKIGSLAIVVGRTAIPTTEDPFLWQWLGKGGSRFGTWEWKYGASGFHIVFTSIFEGKTWGSLFGDWKSYPSPQNYPVMPWFSQIGVKSGDITIYTDSSYYSGTWNLV